MVQAQTTDIDPKFPNLDQAVKFLRPFSHPEVNGGWPLRDPFYLSENFQNITQELNNDKPVHETIVFDKDLFAQAFSIATGKPCEPGFGGIDKFEIRYFLSDMKKQGVIQSSPEGFDKITEGMTLGHYDFRPVKNGAMHFEKNKDGETITAVLIPDSRYEIPLLDLMPAAADDILYFKKSINVEAAREWGIYHELGHGFAAHFIQDHRLADGDNNLKETQADIFGLLKVMKHHSGHMDYPQFIEFIGDLARPRLLAAAWEHDDDHQTVLGIMAFEDMIKDEGKFDKLLVKIEKMDDAHLDELAFKIATDSQGTAKEREELFKDPEHSIEFKQFKEKFGNMDDYIGSVRTDAEARQNFVHAIQDTKDQVMQLPGVDAATVESSIREFNRASIRENNIYKAAPNELYDELIKQAFSKAPLPTIPADISATPLMPPPVATSVHLFVQQP